MVDAKLPRFVVPDLTDFKVPLVFLGFQYSARFSCFSYIKYQSCLYVLYYNLNFVGKENIGILALLLRKIEH